MTGTPLTQRTVIVIPCYNEADRLDGERFAECVSGANGLGLLFVDDGSTDTTAQVLAALVRRVPDRIRALRLAANQGKSGAVRAGVLAALAGGPVYVGFWDADLATPLSAIPRFVEALEARPLLLGAIGARVKLLGTTISVGCSPPAPPWSSAWRCTTPSAAPSSFARGRSCARRSPPRFAAGGRSTWSCWRGWRRRGGGLALHR